jgi:hypothetical protein
VVGDSDSGDSGDSSGDSGDRSDRSDRSERDSGLPDVETKWWPLLPQCDLCNTGQESKFSLTILKATQQHHSGCETGSFSLSDFVQTLLSFPPDANWRSSSYDHLRPQTSCLWPRSLVEMSWGSRISRRKTHRSLQKKKDFLRPNRGSKQEVRTASWRWYLKPHKQTLLKTRWPEVKIFGTRCHEQKPVQRRLFPSGTELRSRMVGTVRQNPKPTFSSRCNRSPSAQRPNCAVFVFLAFPA